MTRAYKEERSFACGCSDESVKVAEGWLQEVLPGAKPEELRIKTGEIVEYSHDVTKRNEETGEWEKTGEKSEGSYEKSREVDLTETLIIALADEGNLRATTYRVHIGYDQWCVVSVDGEAWDRDGRKRYDGTDYPKGDDHVYSCQYDFGLLPYALAAVILQIRENVPVDEDETTRSDRWSSPDP